MTTGLMAKRATSGRSLDLRGPSSLGIIRPQARNGRVLRKAKTNWKISKRSWVCPMKKPARTFIMGGRAGNW